MAALLLVLAFVAVIAVSAVAGLVLGNVVVSLLALRLLRRRRFDLAVPVRYEVSATDVPGGALALLFEYDLATAGYTSLGYLTGAPQFAVWGYQQCWLDRRHPHTCAAVTVRKNSARSKPERVVSLVTPALVDGRAVVVVTGNQPVPPPGSDPYLLSVQRPGVGPDALVAHHRERLQLLDAISTQNFSQLQEVNDLLRGLLEHGLRLEVDRGHVEPVSEGVGRLSWRRCLRAAAASGPMARRLRARRDRRLMATG